mmetsp:Transcript_49074/g.78394  ORF Transcript_49074/g.78394 Transcript_49074/m.78394 type:complete len:159 (-) Transcript_49074:282-758(-)
MCILLTLSPSVHHSHYHALLAGLCFIALCMISTDGSFPHIRVETKLSTLEDITIGVLALVLCIVLTFAAYFLYLRVTVNAQRANTLRTSNQYPSNRVIAINEDCLSDTTALLKKSMTRSYSYDDGLDMDGNNNNANHLSSYVSFGAYGAIDDKESMSS